MIGLPWIRTLPWVFCLLLSGPALAVGLGELQAETRLGQQLNARISIDPGGANISLNELQASVLPPGPDAAPESTHYSYQVTVEEAKGDGFRVRIRSRRPIAEPYLELRVQLRWPGGLLTREYTLLLD
ncbi:type IV pilus assembly protein FimV [Aestuariirhabdus sp. LZHN29]|uniref:type IV pilus assembly protein FimV n=1 Tax=Aestuariirhabdus sp. LZHN29 TaxID=3417462 RepID=UPI003CF5DF6C